MNNEERVVVIGGGPAGLATASAYRDAGGTGEITILTNEPYPPYNRPPLTKEYLRGEMEQDELPLRDRSWYEDSAVDLRLQTRATAVDRDRRIVETDVGEEVPYDACVLATGSEPIRLPISGMDDPEIVVMRTIENSARLQERVDDGDSVVVVGSGFIGCEAAASLSLRGAEVTLVTLEELPQAERLGGEVGGRIKGWLEDYGVDLRLGANLERIERENGGYRVIVEGGDTVRAETVLLGTGVSPRTQLARDAGLEIDGSVITDSSMRTSAPGLFAVGDIAQAYNESARRHLVVEHWGDALEHGRIAGTVIAGGEANWAMAPGFWSTIGDKTIKYWAWGDGWDELSFDGSDDSFTVRYGKDGVLVGILAYGADEAYEEGGALIESRVPFRA